MGLRLLGLGISLPFCTTHRSGRDDSNKLIAHGENNCQLSPVIGLSKGEVARLSGLSKGLSHEKRTIQQDLLGVKDLQWIDGSAQESL